MLMKFLVWLGLTRKQRNGKWFVPFGAPARWMVPRSWVALRRYVKYYGWKPYFFRNDCCDPRFHRRSYLRVLPFRWGFGWMGFEFGDRGGEHHP